MASHTLWHPGTEEKVRCRVRFGSVILRTTSRSTRTHTQVSARRLLVSSIVRGRAGRVWRTAPRPARRSSDRALHFSSGLITASPRLAACSPSHHRLERMTGLASASRAAPVASRARATPRARPSTAPRSHGMGPEQVVVHDSRFTRRRWPLCASPACRRPRVVTDGAIKFWRGRGYRGDLRRRRCCRDRAVATDSGCRLVGPPRNGGCGGVIGV